MDGTTFFGLIIIAVLVWYSWLHISNEFSAEEKKVLKKELAEELRNKLTWFKKEKKNKE